LVAVDTAAELLAVNPFHDLRENRLFGAHAASLALPVLWKNATAIPQDLRKSWNILFNPATRQG
jgi:hypothetical protein